MIPVLIGKDNQNKSCCKPNVAFLFTITLPVVEAFSNFSLYMPDKLIGTKTQASRPFLKSMREPPLRKTWEYSNITQPLS
jgi:hypothetical protein